MLHRVSKMVCAAAGSGGAVAFSFLLICFLSGHDAMEAIFGTWLLVTVPVLVAAFVWWDQGERVQMPRGPDHAIDDEVSP